MVKRYALALDLIDDNELIRVYEEWHKNVWPEVLESIRAAGIEQMEIYRLHNRLFMIMDVNEHFTFENKAKADAANDKVQEWENLMWNFQQSLPFSKPGEKWVLMERIFSLTKW